MDTMIQYQEGYMGYMGDMSYMIIDQHRLQYMGLLALWDI